MSSLTNIAIVVVLVASRLAVWMYTLIIAARMLISVGSMIIRCLSTIRHATWSERSGKQYHSFGGHAPNLANLLIIVVRTHAMNIGLASVRN